MPYQIETPSTIYTRLEGNVSGEVSSLTNFGVNSAERVLLEGEAEYLSRYEHGLLASQLSAWISFSGGPVSEEKLLRLYSPGQIERIDLPFLNSLMVDFDLDQKAIENGVVRDPGSPAVGEALITVSDFDVEVPTGLLVGTQPDATGEYLAYRTAESATPSGETTTVTVEIEAWNDEESEPAVGTDHNIGSNLIEYIPDEQDVSTNDILAVTNPQATFGGEGEESNESLRERAKNALTNRSGGGTTGGIEGQFVSSFAPIEAGDVDVIQHYDGQPTLSITGTEIDSYDPATDPEITGTGGAPYGEVLVNSPQTTDDEFEAFFDRDDVFPATVYHRLLRATRREVGVALDLMGAGDGTNVDTTQIVTALTRHLSQLTLGEDVTDAKVTQTVMNADDDLIDADPSFSLEDEAHNYQAGTTQYALRTPATDVQAVVGTVGGTEQTFDAGREYVTVDSDGDGAIEAIDFNVADQTVTDEAHTYDETIARYDLAEPAASVTSVTGTAGGTATTFAAGTDYQTVDIDGDGAIDAIDWSGGATVPDNGTTFEIDYDVAERTPDDGSTFTIDYGVPEEDIIIDRREVADPGSITTIVSGGGL